jgi:hypothetical protein
MTLDAHGEVASEPYIASEVDVEEVAEPTGSTHNVYKVKFMLQILQSQTILLVITI